METGETRPNAIGPYRLVRPLGQGGMGSVYLAYDESRAQQVAFKFLTNVAGENEELRRRFNAEMQLTGGLLHPNVAAIHEIGEWQGQPFVALEYVPGRSLQQILAERPALTLGRRLDLLDQLCRGLHCAHTAGIVHRDIKPGNLMVTEAWVLKIVDFGIARLLETDASYVAVAGSLGYMSPEQFQGTAVDHRSDIFSVGVVAYELMSFQRPFRGSTLESVMVETLDASPVPLDRLVDGLNRTLASVIMRALAKRPADRFEDLERMRVALRTAAAELGDPVLERPLGITPSAESVASPVRAVDTRAHDGSALPSGEAETAAAEVATRTDTSSRVARADHPQTPTRPQPVLAMVASQNVVIAAFGLLTNALTAALVAFVAVRWHVNVLGLLLVVIPVGAVGSGVLAASGYYAGAIVARRRPTWPLLVVIIAFAIGTFCAIWNVEYRLLPDLVRPASFAEFVSTTLHHGTISSGLGQEIDLGFTGGVILVVLQLGGFAFGGVAVYEMLVCRPYCQRCQRYLVSPVTAKGFGTLDYELEQTYEQVRRFGASGNPMAAVALVRSLPQDELAHQIRVNAWRCGHCAREFFHTQLLERTGGRWVTRQTRALSELAEGAPQDSLARTSWLPRTTAKSLASILVAVGFFSVLSAFQTNPDEFIAEMTRLDAMEKDVARRFVALQSPDQATRKAFAADLVSEIVPAWERERDRLASIPVPAHLAPTRASIAGYMTDRGSGWLDLADGLKTDDLGSVEKWLTKEEQAARALQSVLGREGDDSPTKDKFRTELANRVTQLQELVARARGQQTQLGADVKQGRAVTDEFRAIGSLESEMAVSYGTWVKQLQAGELPSSKFADQVEHTVLTQWNAERRRLSALPVPDSAKAMVKDLVNYMNLRAEAWRLMAEGVRTNNLELVRRGNQKQNDAMALGSRLQLKLELKR